MSPNDLQDLLAKVALRDRAAFRALYEATSAKLFGVLLRLLKDRHDAEDALQMVYVKIWQKAPAFAGSQHSPMGWLVVLTRNHAIDLIRARKPAATSMADGFEVVDQAMNPEQEALNASLGDQLARCLEELETRHAAAVRDAYVLGDSYQEIARKLDVPLNTVRTWLRRGLAKLKTCMEGV
ncbi:MAG: sigma-70 family RNA polymerase sigma factor [Hyphomicrobiales bacterium]